MISPQKDKECNLLKILKNKYSKREKILVTEANGQLGQAFYETLEMFRKKKSY